MSEEFDKTFWEQHYDRHSGSAGGQPSPYLVATADDLEPSTALDAGCGGGADTLWLASRGWQVTAVDIATAALSRAQERAATLDPAVTSRIDWVPADLASWTPAERRFDLVSSHYVHIAGARDVLFRRLAAAVAPGGTLLVVGHHPSDPQHAASPDAYVTAEDIANSLDPGQWEITLADARTRSLDGPEGHAHARTLRDAVLRARRHEV